MADRSTVFSIGGTTPAAAGSAVIKTAKNLGDYDAVTVILEVVGATGGTLDLVLESAWGTESTWYSLYRVPQLAADAAAAVYKFTVSLGNTVNAVGKNGNVTTLTASTPAAGHWGDQIRLYATAGASTSAGAVIVCKIIGHRILR